MPLASIAPALLGLALPPGAPLPSRGWVLAVTAWLVLVVTFNLFWELVKGPPNP